jgi:hypothetical protein
MNSSSNHELLQPLAILIKPVAFYAQLIEQQFNDVLFPPREGVYRLGDVSPVLFANKRYFVQRKMDGRIVLEPITDLSKVEESIVDEEGNLILSGHYMKNKQMFLSNQPTVPSRGIEIVKCLIDEHLAKISPWSKSQGYRQRLNSYFKNAAAVHEIVEDGFLERICESLIMSVNDFIGNDVWNMYFTKVVAVDLLIEKSIDYRIYDWTMQREYKQNEQHS